MPRRFLAILLLFLPLPALAVAPSAPNHPEWTPDDIVNTESASDFHFSPDGRFVVWVKTTPDKDQNAAISHLYRTDLKTTREVQLTRGSDSCTSPRWSPDGSHIAFLSSRPAHKAKNGGKSDEEGKSQLWLLDATGGEPWALTESLRDLQHFDWADDDTLIFSAQEDARHRETFLKDERKDTTIVVEDDRNEPPVRLFRVEVKAKKVTRISDNKDRIEQFTVSPDGKFAVAQHARSLRYLYDNKDKPVVYLHDLTTNKRTKIFDQGKLNISGFVWSPDSATLYATNEHSSKPELNAAGLTELYAYEVAKKTAEKLDLAWARGLATQSENGSVIGVVPVKDGFIAFLADGVRYRLARYTRKEGKLTRQWLNGEHARNTFGLALSSDGKKAVYAHSTASSPTRWYSAKLDGVNLSKPTELAKTNEHLEKHRFARTEVIRWKGAGGEEVEGLLYYPHRWRAGKKYPLVVQIHGGPAAADLDSYDDRWAYPTNLLCQREAFVLKPNYHGSSYYGQAWMESISNGKYCEPELDDIEKGVDELIQKGLVDANKLGLAGWSNGAILTNQLVTRTTRYKAAVAGAGTVEYISDWSSCEFGDSFDRFYLGKSPLEDLSLYIRISPFFRIHKVKTPTLILFGADDRVVHPQQGWAHYRAMQQTSKAPVRFVLFPGEKHGLSKLSHQRRKIEEEMEWFDRYLFIQKKDDTVVIKEGSPLEWLLKKRKAAADGGRYGTRQGGVLVPEVVKYKDLYVGRFEVTEAQYAESNPNRKVAPGRENFPVTGLTFSQAEAYCRWLSKKTGKTYRLPTAEEAETLYEKPETGDNTLDAWAGYTVNPEDAAALRQKLSELPGPAPLLRAVGSGRGVGKEDLVYDLSGNAAEWVREDGKGKLQGGSADQPADDRVSKQQVGEAYRGMRVVLE